MKIRLRYFLPCLVALGLSACGDEVQETKAEQVASGEILGRSVTDEMLPFDTLKSHPPLETPKKPDGDASLPSDADAAEEGTATETPDPSAEAVAPGVTQDAE